jgi:release factor glutamine methyltransferase
MTVAALLSDAAATLAAAGVEAPERDAERLLRHVLGWDRARLIAHPEHEVPPEGAAVFGALLARRASREPLQYILGTQAFWKHVFLVTPAVLIPRPETEVLVETALELLSDVRRPVIVDVGTGSGCIALSLAAERPDAEVHATDISEPALDVARENARRLGLERGVAFHPGDLLDPLASLTGRIDLLVSNPPYVDSADRPGLAPEVRDHEPPEALFPPGGTLAVYRRLATAAALSLRGGGWLALEVSPFVAGEVSAILAPAGFAAPSVRPDLAGRPRVVFARRLAPRFPSVG